MLAVLLCCVLAPQALSAQTVSIPEPRPRPDEAVVKLESQAGLRKLLLSRWRLISTPTPATEDAPAIDEAAQLKAGRQVYLDNYCGTCHTLAAAGTGGIFGPSHDQMASVAVERIADESYSGSAMTSEAYILESILKPQVYLAPGSTMSHQQMPPYTHLEKEALNALVYFLLQQK
jgi:mono/diheme cytochrome c family protein